jgi:MFS family permease
MGTTRMEEEAFDQERRETIAVGPSPTEEPDTASPLRQPQRSGAFRALRNRNFRLFWTGQLISLIGTWAQNLAQGWLIVLLVDPVARAMLRHGGAAAGAATQHHRADVEGAANFYSGWVNFAGGLPIFLLTILAGVVADRVDKRKMLLVTQSALILCAVGLGVLCVLGRVEIWHVMFFAALSGIAAAFDMPTRQSFIAEMVGKEDLPSAIALNSSIFNAARALGPAVAGLLLAANVSIGAAFLGNAVLSLAVIAGLLLIRLPEHSHKMMASADKSLHGVWASTVEGFRYVKSHDTVRNLVILVGSFGTFAFSFNVLIPVFVRFTLLPHASDAVQVKAFGFMETVRGVGALGGALTVAFLGSARRQRNMLITGALLATVLLVVFAEARTLWLAYVTMCIVSYGFVLCFATSNTLMQLNVPDRLRGRVMSIYTLMFIGTMPFGSLFAGWLAKFIGAPVTILICALVSLLTTLIVVFRPGGLRDLRTMPVRKVQAAV